MIKKGTLILLVFVFGCTFELFCLGKKDGPDFILANGTGSKISKIQITPCTEKYPNSGKEFNLDKLDFKDTGVLSISLPADMKGFDTFNISIQCGVRKYKTTQSVGTAKNFLGKPQLLDLSKKGKDSTFVVATGAGAAGGAIAVGGIATIFATGVATNGGAAYVTWALGIVGSVVGGGMAAGVAVVAAIPLAAAAVVGGISWGVSNLFPGELVVRSINYKTID